MSFTIVVDLLARWPMHGNRCARRPNANVRYSPHVLRHTAATLFMQAGVDVAVVAGYLGMSIEVLWTVYGHHSPMFQSEIAQATPKKQTNRKRTG